MIRNAEARRRYERQFRQDNLEKVRAADRAWASQNRVRIWAKQIKLRYQISLVRWLALFHMQGERCALCHTTDHGARRWVTDHDHETRRVRGILCNRCNTHIAWLGDNAASVRAMTSRIVDYMRSE